MPWIVPALALGPRDCLNLLLSLPERTPPGVLIGDSLRFFGEVAKLALELVARGRMLPALMKRDEQFHAVWQPVADGENDAERLRLLTRSMPAVCRAEFAGGLMEGRMPAAIIGDIVEHLADAAARQALDGISLLPERGRKRSNHRTATEAWLTALTSENSIVGAQPDDLITLQESLDEWCSSAFSVMGESLRTCFRLSSPDEAAGKTETTRAARTDQSWRLEFLLQATDDKSLLLPAEMVWKTRGEALKLSSRMLENPQEKLLEDLGRAARLYPELELALKTAKPVGHNLDAGGAYRFLREAAPLLEQSGFGVLVPSWWKKPSARLGVKLKARPKDNKKIISSGLLGLDAICDYEWEIALGDEKFSFKDFMKLASLKVPLVRVRGQWIELKQEEIETALAFFKKRASAGEMTAGEALRIGLGLEASQVGLPVTGVEAEGWLGDLLQTNGNRRFESLKSPKGFSGKLRPYQERGLSWLSFLSSIGLGACLADDMGLGKTIQLLALLVAERQTNGSKKAPRPAPTLLICPMSVVGNWQREAARFAPALRVHVHHGAERLSGEEFDEVVKSDDMVITTYALAARDREMLGAIEWSRIVLDEAQNIKNSAARQTQAIRSFKAGGRVALTGTPVENRLSELWSIMQFLNPGLLGSAKDFQTRFAIPIERYHEEQKATLLKRITGPFILRRLKTDKSVIKDLPDKIEIKTFCNLTKEQASLYQAVVDEMMEKIEESEGIERRGLVLATMMKLKQVCNHPAQLVQDGSSLEGRSGKLTRLEEILEEVLAEGDRALCFTQFAEMGHMLKQRLQERFGREALFLHGGTSKKARDQMVERFQQEGGPPLFLLSLRAGGTGLNLTAAQHVIHFDRWWNPAVEDQATDRAFRIGQKKNVQVRKFICAGTLEERIDQLIEQKKDLAKRIVGTGESWLTELTTAQIRELVQLSSDAVSEE
jgi:SNF2 family DNA or RNA helicase